MYKIMLVEDEPATLSAMTSTLDWNALSFQTPLACPHGQAAIDAIQGGFLPDAVITDICMPFVDGVQLTEYLSEHCPQALVVMLTGYDDFTYAHRAIQLKVYDYVLKPITPKSLRLLAQRLCDELENRRIKHADEFDALTRERFFIQLLTTRLSPKTIEDNLRVHKVSLNQTCWTVLVADLGLPAAVTAEQSCDAELLRYGLGNILAELAQELPCTVACVPVKETYCVVLAGASDGLTPTQTARELTRTAHELAGASGGDLTRTAHEPTQTAHEPTQTAHEPTQTAHEPTQTARELTQMAHELALRTADACKLIKQTVTCGVGRPVGSPAELYACHMQAVLSLQYRFFFGHVPCILEEEILMQPTAQFDYAAHEQALSAAVKQGSREKALDALKTMCRQMQTQKLPYEQCLRTCQRTLLHFLDWMGDYLSAEETAELERVWDNTNLFAATTLEQLQSMLRNVCELAFDSFSLVGTDDATLRVRKAEAYIRDHYGDATLSLNTIRDEFSISVSYFSAIFKAGTGGTFVEYLTQVRLEKAKELLTLTEKRIGEIAAEVGFSDTHYFSITFKRLTGLTPREYRLRQRELP